jgi:hypothetical protein
VSATTAFKTLTTDEVATADGKKWVRPRLHYDASSEHVPPPPPGPIPDDVLAMPPVLNAAGETTQEAVSMPVLRQGASGGVTKVATRASAGVYRSPAAVAKAKVHWRKAALAVSATTAFKNLTIEEVMDAASGTKWLRPNLHYDASSEHVPPPPAGPIPDDVLAKPPALGAEGQSTQKPVAMTVLDQTLTSGSRTLKTRASAGVDRKTETAAKAKKLWKKAAVTVKVSSAFVDVISATSADSSVDTSDAIMASVLDVK